VDERAQSERSDRAVPWGVWQVVLAGVMTIGLMVAAGVVVALTATLQGRLPDLTSPALFQALFALEALFLLPPWLLGPLRYHLPWSVLGFRPTAFGRAAVVTIVGLGLVLLADAGWTAIVSALGLELTEQPDVLPYFGGGPGGLAMALLLGAVVAPVAEETLFRGYVYPGLAHSWGRTAGLLVSAAVFALLHGFSAVIPPIFVIGIILALSYDLTDSLWPPIAIHALMNGLAFVSSYVIETGAAGLGV